MLAGLAHVIAQFPSLPSPGEGTEGFRRLMTVFGTLMGLGFVLGILGHVFKLRAMVLVGVLLVFAATGLFLVAVAQHG
jgi:hypothetical protein